MQFSVSIMSVIIVLLIILLISFKDNKKEKFIKTKHSSDNTKIRPSNRNEVNKILCSNTQNIGNYDTQCYIPCEKLTDSNSETCTTHVDPDDTTSNCAWIDKLFTSPKVQNVSIASLLNIKNPECVNNKKANELIKTAESTYLKIIANRLRKIINH